MRANHGEIVRIMSQQGGAISRSAHPELAASIAWLVRRGDLVPALPGVYIASEHADPVRAKMAAVRLWHPDAVLVGEAAARLTFWPEVEIRRIGVAVPNRHTQAGGYRIARRRLDPDLVEEQHGLRYTTAAATAMDLCTSHGGDVIDRVLRSRKSVLSDLARALELSGGRPGNRSRRELLLDSRDSPWSCAERETHRLLREAGIGGWRANWPVRLLATTYYVDVAFPEIKLAIEIDGREFHSSAQAFEGDRWRQNDLILAGWTILRFTYTMVTQRPGVVIATIRRALGA